MKNRFLFYLLICLVSQSANAISDITEESFSSLENDSYWFKLLHYKKNLLGGIYSQADGLDFFYAQDGNHDPVKEGYHSYLAFLKKPTGRNDYHAQCRFPERYRYLKSKFQLNIKDITCPAFTEWINKIDPVGLALVYAANFPNNPGSVMGHTFIKVISSKDSALQKGKLKGKHLDLLDYSISYAAQTAVSTGIVYAMKGLFGGYRGLYSLEPYYLKVREYNKGDGRDLWEYELNIKYPRRMLAHLWEITKNTYFNYFFIDENCSYHLLTLLDIANPNWELANDFNLYTAPYDTVKAVMTIDDAVKSIHYRPSLPNKVAMLIDQLSAEEKQQFTGIVNETLSIKEGGYSKKLLEAVINYIFYLKVENKNKFEENQKDIYMAALIKRSKLGPKKEKIYFKTPEIGRPDQGHDTSNTILSFGKVGDKHYQDLSLQTGVHSFMSNDVGFAKFSILEAVKFKIRRIKDDTNRHKIKYREFVALDSKSFIDITNYEKPFSWGIRIAHHIPKDYQKTNKQFFQLWPEVGYTNIFNDKQAMIYGLLGVNLEQSYTLQQGIRGGFTFSVGAAIDIARKARLHVKSQIISDLFQDDRQEYYTLHSVEGSYFLLRNLSLKLDINKLIRGSHQGINILDSSLSLVVNF